MTTRLHLARWVLVPIVAAALTFAIALNLHASTPEREGIDDLAAALIDDSVMEQLAETMQDPTASTACRGYADMLLLVGTYVRHLLTYPESLVARSEFSGRVMASVPPAQYRCEVAM